jgi:hypothetical protein
MAMTTRPPRPAAAPPRPSVPAPVAAATWAFWGAVSTLRGRRRSLHTIGQSYEARFVVPSGGGLGVDLFDRPATHDAIVRFSRGAGLPEPLPDILGIAVRVIDAHDDGAHQDFLCASSADLPVAHHLLLPATSFFDRTFSTVLPYSIGGSVRLLGVQADSPMPHGGDGGLGGVATAAARGELRYTLACAAPFGRFQRIAGIEVGARVPDDESERLRFNPWNTGGGIRPAGPFQGVRLPAYDGSQRGRRT